ncbi:DUF6354 family protein [Streptomyces sp. NPDC059443]|uniref:DUF6354 family protein n=1 Tax=unclassified Streptomyces TaxID=2593676 RepID=UPI00369EBF30
MSDQLTDPPKRQALATDTDPHYTALLAALTRVHHPAATPADYAHAAWTVLGAGAGAGAGGGGGGAGARTATGCVDG